MTKENLQSQLRDADEQLNKLDNERSLVISKIQEIKLQIVELEWGVKIGSIVRKVTRRLGEKQPTDVLIKVAAIYSASGQPWIYGYRQKKDGSWSKRSECFYAEWELVTA